MSTTVSPESTPVASAGLARGAADHQARMTIRLVVACLTPRGTRCGMGWLAGLRQSDLPQPQCGPLGQYTGNTGRPQRACAIADCKRRLVVAVGVCMTHYQAS